MSNSPVYDYIKRYHQQIELFYYQNQRVIVRPKTNIFHIVICIAVYLFVITFCVIMNVMIDQPIVYELPVSVTVYALISEYLLRYIGIKAVECYQHYATEETRRNCLCVPSCSEYAILCLKKYELIHALLKIRKRLFVTCKGSDYIIDDP